MRDGGGNPPALENRPEVHGWMKEYIDGFYTLSSSRTFGMAANPIQFSEMIAYIKYRRVPDPDRFIEHVRRMDQEYLNVSEEVRKNRPPEQSKPPAKSGVSNGRSNRRR